MRKIENRTCQNCGQQYCEFIIKGLCRSCYNRNNWGKWKNKSKKADQTAKAKVAYVKPQIIIRCYVHLNPEKFADACNQYIKQSL